jgi:hypothetical protein
VPRELALLLAVAATLALAWSLVTAPLQGPDEVTHVSYVQQLAETGRGPFPDRGDGNVSTELRTALERLDLGALVGAPQARPPRGALQRSEWERLSAAITAEQRADGTGPSPLARNPQLYYAYEAVPYLVLRDADLFDRLTAMRLANAALFVVTVLLAWLLAIELFGPASRLRATVAAATVALWPMLTFMAGVVNPDTALVTAYTALALLAVRLVRRGPTLGRVVALCAAASACLLVHGRGLASVGVVLVALVAAAARHRPPLRAMAAWGALGATVATVPLVVSKLLLAPGSGGGLYGGEANLGRTFSVKDFLSQTWQFYAERLSFMTPRLGPEYGYRQVVVERFAGGIFGSLEVLYPPWVYDLIQYAIIGLAIALWTAVVLRRDRLRHAWPVLAVLGALAIGLMTLLHLASYRALVGGSPDPLVTGRYLLPLAPLVAVTLAWLIGELPRRARAATAGGLVIVLLLMQLGGLGMTFVRFHV